MKSEFQIEFYLILQNLWQIAISLETRKSSHVTILYQNIVKFYSAEMIEKDRRFKIVCTFGCLEITDLNWDY